MKAALYARVSRTDQQTIPAQLSEMREYCARRGWKIAFEFEEQMSGAKDTRPKYRELLKLAQAGKVDCILVWKLDRWGRSSAEILGSLVQLKNCSVSFVSVTEGFDLTTPIGEAMAGLLAIFAQFERSMIIARTKEGLKLAKERGAVFGRPKIDSEKRGAVVAFAKAGHGPAKIAELTGVPESSVRRIVKNEIR